MMRKNFKNLYEGQHAIWPAWSDSKNEAEIKVKSIVKWLNIPAGSKILDVGCGNGREVISFAKSGFKAEGIDNSEVLISQAKAKAGKENFLYKPKFTVADILSFRGKSKYDLITFFDSTLQIFLPEQKYNILSALPQRLEDKGWVVIEQLSIEYWKGVDSAFTYKSKAIGPGKTSRHYRFDKEKKVLLDDVIYYPENDGKPISLPTQRLYLDEPSSLARLLKPIGFSKIESMWITNGVLSGLKTRNENSIALITKACYTQ